MDLHLKPPTSNMSEVGEIFRRTSQLGYDAVGMVLPTETPAPLIERCYALAEEQELDLVARLNLKPKTPNQLLRELGRWRRRYEVVAVECCTKQVARQAAKDHRVDLLDFPLTHKRSWFDEAEVELASSSNVHLEIDVVETLRADKEVLFRVLAELRRRVTLATRGRIGIIASTGAETALDLRGPKDLAAFIQLLGLTQKASKAAVSSSPLEIIRRNREKLKPSQAGLGVKIVEVGSVLDGQDG